MNNFKEEVLFKIKDEFILENNRIHKRYFHTIGVVEMALKLNEIHQLGIKKEKIILAGAYHDIAKLLDKEKLWKIITDNYPNMKCELKDYPQVWHSFAGCIYAKEKYGIDDLEVLDAIKYHTTGKVGMNNLEKLIFIADYVEEITRLEEPMVIAREIALKNFNEGFLRTIKDTIDYLKKENKNIFHVTYEVFEYYSKGNC